jgi:O-antigen/teichoic acid export membrane protein
MSELENRFRRGISWSVIGQFVFLLIMFTTNVVLARIVSPREFGVIAIASFFISISNLMTDSGLSGALVRKNDVNDVDYSTMFIFNIVISLTLYIILFSSSSYIQDYFQIEKLSVYLKLLGLVFIISSFR